MRVLSQGQEDPIPVFLPGESHGQRSLVGYSPWGLKELDMSDRLSTNTHTMKQMFFWNSLAFSMIHQMLAICYLVPLPFLNPVYTSGSFQLTYC